jgi:primase-polymerase (primpol)-like protein
MNFTEIATTTKAALESLRTAWGQLAGQYASSSYKSEDAARVRESLRLTQEALEELSSLRDTILAGGSGVHSSPEAAYSFWCEYAENTWNTIAAAKGYSEKWNFSGRLEQLAVTVVENAPKAAGAAFGGVGVLLGGFIALEALRLARGK